MRFGILRISQHLRLHLQLQQHNVRARSDMHNRVETQDSRWRHHLPAKHGQMDRHGHGVTEQDFGAFGVVALTSFYS